MNGFDYISDTHIKFQIDLIYHFMFLIISLSKNFMVSLSVINILNRQGTAFKIQWYSNTLFVVISIKKYTYIFLLFYRLFNLFFNFGHGNGNTFNLVPRDPLYNIFIIWVYTDFIVCISKVQNSRNRDYFSCYQVHIYASVIPFYSETTFFHLNYC